MNCDSWLLPKNSRTAAAAGLALIRSCGITVSMSTEPMRSRIARSMRSRPTRYWFSISSPTERTRRLPRLSMSSIAPRPSFNSHMIFTVFSTSSLRRTRTCVLHVHAQPHVHLHAADRGQVVAVAVEEQPAEQRLGRLGGRRLARDASRDRCRSAHPRGEAFLSTASVLRIHGPFDWSTASVGSRSIPAILQCRQPRLGQLLARLGIDLAGFLVHQVDQPRTAPAGRRARPAPPWSSRRSCAPSARSAWSRPRPPPRRSRRRPAAPSA